MEEVKRIVASFIQVGPEEIGAQTTIDKRRMRSSILIHRMYAALSAAGFKVNDYAGISTYGELLSRLGGKGEPVAAPAASPPQVPVESDSAGGLGVDIESVSMMPETTDFRTHPFYAKNFTAKEISYCVLQQDPRQSFAGLFCAKEAIKKTGGGFGNLPLHAIEITHNDSGLPAFPGFQLSISHADGIAVAVASSARVDRPAAPMPAVAATVPQGHSKLLWFLCLFAAIASMIALFLAWP